jgi:hypothetical protein
LTTRSAPLAEEEGKNKAEAPWQRRHVLLLCGLGSAMQGDVGWWECGRGMARATDRGVWWAARCCRCRWACDVMNVAVGSAALQRKSCCAIAEAMRN